MAEDKNHIEELNNDIVNLVVARLSAIPVEATLSLGDKGSFSISELIDRVRSGDEIGKEIIQIQLEYLRSLKDLPIEDNVLTSN